MTEGLSTQDDLPPLLLIGPDPIFLGSFFMTDEALGSLEAILEWGRAYREWQTVEERYKRIIDDPHQGKPFSEVYDLEFLELINERLAFKYRVQQEIICIGLDLESG